MFFCRPGELLFVEPSTLGGGLVQALIEVPIRETEAQIELNRDVSPGTGIGTSDKGVSGCMVSSSAGRLA